MLFHAFLLCLVFHSFSANAQYIWRNVTIGGGGFVTGIITHPREKGLMYARTDVGGAYRWDTTSQKWIPITDWIGMGDANLTGIESLALDPADPNRVYLAAGTYSTTDAAILGSDDRGKTFKRTNVPFKMGGNETGRFNGERLAVDPNKGDILFFGSRYAGLWKSTDRGVAWHRIETFPRVEGETTTANEVRADVQSAGIVCVLFDPVSGKSGEATPKLWAAVSTTNASLYCSTNAGISWHRVSEQPIGLRPNHVVLSPDGILYISYGKEPGPNTMTDGAVWKFSPADGRWTNITPLSPVAGEQPFGYGAVSVDAAQPSTIMVTTFCRWRPHDEVFRSTNGGLNWTPLLEKAVWDHSSAPYTKERTPHWMGDIEINPFDGNNVLFTTGYGIWSCTNATETEQGKASQWVFFNNGLEETVPLALLSPPTGAHLLSGLGDIDGFRHDDFNVSPRHGNFAGPRYSNTEDMAFAGRAPHVIVRTGTGRSIVHAAISRDGGVTWSALASEPVNSTGAGTIAISADGKTIVWTPRRASPFYTTDGGTNWNSCLGLRTGMEVVADRENPLCFYSFDARAGRLIISTNGAANFTATEGVLPQFSPARRFGSATAKLFVAPGMQGDLWLAFGNNGLFHSPDGGGSFSKVENVQQADALGFGMAAPEAKTPAIYLAGIANGKQALFRSVDAGKTWLRINDDQHQFGWINRITGDPRVFGRVYLATGGRGLLYGEPAPVSH
jgi:photosystem II stability/assembly factor-like uncharacterized protein